MDTEEAKRVLEILFQADGGNEYCVANLVMIFIGEFPEHQGLALELFKKYFDRDLEDYF
ncbi:MAG: hypothetical protein NC926_10675 [Candidatus Omnitrophica bacterium]|nr:hypothetical protein [Candidatus Omnitrophota bacterium]